MLIVIDTYVTYFNNGHTSGVQCMSCRVGLYQLEVAVQVGLLGINSLCLSQFTADDGYCKLLLLIIITVIIIIIIIIILVIWLVTCVYEIVNLVN